MEHFFNIAGPSEARKHYLIDPLQRINIRQIETLIAQEYYFVLHAPRQTGKTSCLLALMEYLNQQNQYQALYVNIETAQVARNDVARGNYTVAESIAMAADYYLQQEHLLTWLDTHYRPQQGDNLVRHLLQYWSLQAEQPVVLFLDEMDALVGDTLISLLRQIRAGYAQCPQAFPVSIVLCGVRDVRDYRMQTADREVITGGSAFNIKATSLRLDNFSADEVQELWQQHTQATGQLFAEAIYPVLWQDTP